MTKSSKQKVSELASLGIDIGRNVFHLVGFDGDGKIVPCLSGYHPHPLYVVCTHFPE